VEALEEGVPKRRVENITYIDAISDEKKMIEAFLTIIKEMAIKHGVDRAA